MNRTYKYTLPKGMEVEKTNVRVENGQILVDVELKEKFEPKDGDFLMGELTEAVIIYKSTNIDGGVVSYTGGTLVKNTHISLRTDCGWGYTESYRYATEEEKSAFLERLEKELHKRWNPDKKCLEDIYVPKFGDIVRVENPSIVFERDYTICIYPNKNEQYNQCYIEDFFDIANIDMSGRLCFSCGNAPVGRLNIVRASESEKQELFDKLAEVGKRWNPDTKQFENIRWKPKEGETYYFVDTVLSIVRTEFTNMISTDRIRVEANNCFKTKEATQIVAEQLKDIFKNSKAE